ncbi:uncharacterized protein DSM5745_08612 [Aspergillus mulundensis]|uniref:Nephrocystin 3-like N-terminal domain-containing protein n=1 Tax=Aspergillus mulundensis TaxID=1810919 RepID=A0A3D8R465_9EURO|nr:hypothetical protein DSM5745_08612 [Aspergillus mulundensis]RDW68852.1 hypothetical protein DSM5745_08612 [Aspergillus mulundensis]
MDPLSALSVAAAVVAFVDFGGKLANTYFEVRASIKGQPAEILNLDASAADLSSVASTARENVKSLSLSYPRHAESLSRLTTEVTQIETKIKHAMDKLTVSPKSYFTKRGSTVAVAVRTVWSASELEQWNKQLERIRDQVMMNVLMCVWEETRNTDSKTEQVLQAVERIKKAMETLTDEGGGTAAGLLSPSSSKPNPQKVYQALWESTAWVDIPSNLPSPRVLNPPLHTMSDLGGAAEEREPDFTKRILRSLYSKEMDDRTHQIRPAYPNTFLWLFEERNHGDETNPLELSFRTWLASQDETTFWITGVPASGKSTLMRFISEHPQTGDILRQWAGEDELHIASFYFWNPGSTVQKSRVGLLQSLLYTLVKDRPDLAEIVAARRRLFFDLSEQAAELPEWEWTELCACFIRLASRFKVTGARLALFIDGLDEYEDFVEDHPKSISMTNELVQFLNTLQSEYGVKLCVSSRPLNYFRDKFKDCPTLAMQQLTEPDIDLYVEGRLQESEAFKEIRDLQPEGVNQLIQDLKAKAQGVFLWVALVVEQLLLTSMDNPKMEALQKTLNDLPADLNKLYDTIQRQIGPEKAEEASKLYQLLMEWKRLYNRPISATLLWLANTNPINQPEYPDDDAEWRIIKLTKRLLEGHTRGMLQVSIIGTYSTTVDFLHRTAYDWIREPQNWNEIVRKGPAEYCPTVSLLAVVVCSARSASDSVVRTSNLGENYGKQIFQHAGEVPDTSRTRTQLVSILDSLDPGPFRGRKTPKYHGTAVQNSMMWAAAYGCHSFLEAKLGPPTPGRHRFQLFSRWAQPLENRLLQVALFGDEIKMDAWEATKRLRTMKVLLERGARISSSMIKALKILKEETYSRQKEVYACLLLSLARRRDILSVFDAEVQAAFPDQAVQEARRTRFLRDQLQWFNPVG